MLMLMLMHPYAYKAFPLEKEKEKQTTEVDPSFKAFLDEGDVVQASKELLSTLKE